MARESTIFISGFKGWSIGYNYLSDETTYHDYTKAYPNAYTVIQKLAISSIFLTISPTKSWNYHRIFECINNRFANDRCVARVIITEWG
jgi:hypothetical protein